MKKNTQALTLTELIIASVLVSMVIAGVVNTDFAIRRIDKNTNQDSQLSLATTNMAELIRYDVRRTHGYIDNALNSAKTGINVDIPNHTVCFRYDIQVAGQYTPKNYADDNWSCYTQPAGNTAVYQCLFNGGAGTCTAADTFVGRLVSDEFSNATILALPSPQVVANRATGVFYFDMTLVNRADPSAGAHVLAGSLTKGILDNPQFSVRIQENIGDF